MFADAGSAVIQRVTSASVTIDKQLISTIGRGILVFAAVGPKDTQKEIDTMAARVLKLKIWPDDAGSGVRLNASEAEIHL